MSTFGAYRGTVRNASDPLSRLRLQVSVPAVSADAWVWAEACLPAGRKSLPKVGSMVWVVYEGGNSDHPVWMGVLPSERV
jgi:hypothetical protein